MRNPSQTEVQELRELLQSKKDLGITKAQDVCAENLHTSRRAWQQWERGERKMHRAFWELINIKLSEMVNSND